MAGFKPYIIYLWIVTDLVESLSVLQGNETINYCLPDKYCIKLFELEHNLSWKQATGFCEERGAGALAIYNHTIQDEVMAVLKSFHPPHDIVVWLAGQSNLNITWTSVNPDTVFHGQGQNIAEENIDSKNCLTGTYSNSGSPSYQAVSCSDTQTDNKLICQVKCDAAGGRCFHAVNETSTDWYRAQSVCQERYGGDLLHELPLRYSDLGSLTAWLSIGDTLWIGTWRRPWRWSYSSKADWINMRYFNWAPGAGGKLSIEAMLCTVMRSDTGLWQDVPCYDTYQHVLCVDENINTSPTTSTAATRTPTPPQTTTVTMDRSTPASTQGTVDGTIDSDGHTLTGTSRYDNTITTSGLNAQSVKSGTSGFRLVYTAAVVVPLVAIAVSISVAVVWIRRRKTKQTTKTTYVNTGTPATEITERDYAPLASPHLTTIPNNVYDHLDNQTATGDDIQAADYYNLQTSDQSTRQEQSYSDHDDSGNVTSIGTAENMLQGFGHYENVHNGIPGSVEQRLQRPYGNMNYGDHTGDYEMV